MENDNLMNRQLPGLPFTCKMKRNRRTLKLEVFLLGLAILFLHLSLPLLLILHQMEIIKYTNRD
jgi:hypothetical protein